MDWKLILPIAGGIIIVSGFILFFILKWNRALRREVAERKRVEAAIKDSEQSMAQIINFLPDPTWVVDKDGIVVAWNRALEKITGVKAEDMLGRGNYEYALPFYRERRPVLIDLVRVWDTEYEKEYVSVKKEGETLISESLHPNLGENGLYLSGTARLLHDPSGEVMGAIESLRDITEHKQVEEAIQKSEKEYRTLFENANDAILVAQDQKLCLANPQLEKLLGFSQEELTSRPVTDFFHPEERHVILERHEKRLKGESIPDTYVSRVVDKLGATKWVELKVVLIEWDDRPAVLGFMADITERKQAEEELRQNLQELETFSKMAVGREEQMIELKKEINELLREAGKSEKYKIVT
jgi:PAS domain S-box-containing protein